MYLKSVGYFHKLKITKHFQNSYTYSKLYMVGTLTIYFDIYKTLLSL